MRGGPKGRAPQPNGISWVLEPSFSLALRTTYRPFSIIVANSLRACSHTSGFGDQLTSV